MFKLLILTLTIMPSLLTGKIIETDLFGEVINHLSPNTMIFCDLDNTLIEASQQFGSVQWGDIYRRQLIESGESPEKAEEIVNNLWLQMLSIITMRLVDAEAPGIIQKIQQNGHVVLGLTARYPEEAQYTHPQLDQVGIYFDNRFSDREFFFHAPVLYENGILFCGTNKKSEVLIAFLKQLNLFPQKIIFIDDKLSHVQDLEHALAPLNIDYVGIRFSKADKRIEEYDHKIVDIQLELFPPFISDEEAYQLLSMREENSLSISQW